MSQPPLFTVYRSSAGSGKTRTLIRDYLLMALTERSDYFSRILAVTFTNKATQEMKERILKGLENFKNNNQDEPLFEEVRSKLNLSQSDFIEYSNQLLNAILHQYSQFSVSTIDSFFQRIIRHFTREAGLASDFRLELEADTAIDTIVESMLHDLGPDNPGITNWISEFLLDKMMDGDKWRIKRDLAEFAGHLTKDQFLEIRNEFIAQPKTLERMKADQESLWKIMAQVQMIKADAKELMADVQRRGYVKDDFSAKRFYLKLEAVANLKPSDFEAILELFEFATNEPAKFFRKPDLKKNGNEAYVLDVLIPALQKMESTHGIALQDAWTASIILKNFYQVGLISELTQRLNAYKKEKGILFLFETPGLLQHIIGDNETPFIYERAGSRFNHFLIDEFQDTSRTQWRNFLPLVTNSVSQGKASLVVGDIKQAIYRWRGGDLQILQREIQKSFHNVELVNLDTNYRSGRAIVDFNNRLFQFIRSATWENIDGSQIDAVYEDVEQKSFVQEEGWVEVRMVEKDEQLSLLPEIIEHLLDNGVRSSDICYLVHTNKQGQELVQFMNTFHHSAQAKEGYSYQVVSGESMRIDAANVVKLLVALLEFLSDHKNRVAMATVLTELARLENREVDHSILTGANHGDFLAQLPEEFRNSRYEWQRLPLSELVENLIRTFDLGKYQDQLAYLIAFQEAVLEFSRNDQQILRFLEWWDVERTKLSLPIPESLNAARVYTIHKSKGLQFPVVIIPFCNWNLASKDSLCWVNLETPPFDTIGYFPVKMTKELLNTRIRSEYQSEMLKQAIDQLNALYVAVTRAEQGLVILAEKTNVIKGINKVSHIIQQFTELQGSTFGKLLYEPKDTKVASSALKNYSTGKWRSRLTIRKSMIGEGEARLRGIRIHQLLSGIKTLDDLEGEAQKAISAGMMTTEEAETTVTIIRRWAEEPVFANWFHADWEIHTEISILVPGIGERRPDRLLIRGTTAIVIDYKTGSESKEHADQVLEYMRILKTMKFEKVQGFLVYTNSQQYKEVIKQSKPSRKADFGADLFS